jgi:hypothetical protein
MNKLIMGAMAHSFGLGKYKIIGFVSIVDVPRARNFYRDTLGLRLVMEEPPFAWRKRLPQRMAQFWAGKFRRSPQL